MAEAKDEGDGEGEGKEGATSVFGAGPTLACARSRTGGGIKEDTMLPGDAYGEASSWWADARGCDERGRRSKVKRAVVQEQSRTSRARKLVQPVSLDGRNKTSIVLHVTCVVYKESRQAARN